MVCLPNGRALVENTATPPTTGTADPPAMTWPSDWNWTVPPGTPMPLVTCTAAVKVTVLPNGAGSCDDCKVTVTVPVATVTVAAVVDAEPLKLLSPLYVAVTLWVP